MKEKSKIVPLSQNKWTVLDSADQCRKWIIPVKQGAKRHYILRPGPAGFVLAHFLLWYHENIEPINEGVWDEWGWAPRPIRGSTTVYSNHASATAVDVNATKHPLGQRNTFSYRWQVLKIRARLVFYRGVIRWGGDYHGRPDEMHFEIIKGRRAVRRLAKFLARTPRGRRIKKANPQ